MVNKNREKTKEIGLDLDKIDLNILENILKKTESEARKYLKEKIPPNTDYDLILSVEKNKDITFRIDLGIRGEYEEIINYREIVGDTINVARKIFEQEIGKYSRERKSIGKDQE